MPRTGLTLQTFGGLGIDVSQPVVYVSVVSKSTRGRNTRRIAAGQSDNSTSFQASTSNSTLLSNRLLALKVTADAKRVMEAELTFYNEDLALLDTPIMQKGTLVKLAWGYSGYMGKVRTFKVHKVKGTTARVSNFGQLKIIALGQTFDLHGAVKSKCYTNTSIVGVVRRIARKYGIGNSDLVLGPDDRKRGTYHQVNQTDAQFLKSLAQKLGWTFFVEDGVLTFAPPDGIDKNLPIASYTYFNDDEGWIKRFEPTTNVMSIPGSVTVSSRDPQSGKKVQHTQTIQQRKKKSLCRFVETVPAKKGGSQVVDKGKRFHRNRAPLKSGVVPSSQVVNSPGKNASQVKQEAKTRHNNALLHAVKSRMVIIGDPDIWHSVLLHIEGLGKMLSGLHRVYKAVIYLDSRGFEIDCKLRREGVGTLGKGKRAKPAQKAKAQRVTKRLRKRVGTVIKLDPIVITGKVQRPKVIKLDPILITGVVKRKRFKRN